MKTNLLKAFAFAIAMTLTYNCSVEPADDISLTSEITILETVVQVAETQSQIDECTGTNPKARITNNGTVSFHYEIYDSTTATMIVEISNIMPGTTTDWTDFPEGIIVFNLENHSGSDQKVVHLMENCMQIDMEIDINNLLTAAIPEAISN